MKIVSQTYRVSLLVAKRQIERHLGIEVLIEPHPFEIDGGADVEAARRQISGQAHAPDRATIKTDKYAVIFSSILSFPGFARFGDAGAAGA